MSALKWIAALHLRRIGHSNRTLLVGVGQNTMVRSGSGGQILQDGWNVRQLLPLANRFTRVLS